MPEPLIILIGKSLSGKTTLVNSVLESYPDLSKVISYTTRPQRSNEENLVDYYFVDESYFNDKADRILSKRKYYPNVPKDQKDSDGSWSYGIDQESFIKDKAQIVILDVEGAIEILRKISIAARRKVCIVYLDVPSGILKGRAISRDTSLMNEQLRRLEVDEKDFENAYRIANFTLVGDQSIEVATRNLIEIVEVLRS